MIIIIRQFLYYIILLLKEAILYLILALDIFGILITYYTRFTIPTWFLLSMPFLAFLISAFKIYRRGASEIRLIITKPEETKFSYEGGTNDLTQTFSAELKGHIANYGSQSGIFEEYSYEYGLNDIFDPYVLDNVNINIEFSKIVKSESTYYSKKNIQTPIVLKPSSITPIKIIITLEFPLFNQEEIEKSIDWLKKITLIINYLESFSYGNRKKIVDVSIPTLSLIIAVSEGKKFKHLLKKST